MMLIIKDWFLNTFQSGDSINILAGITALTLIGVSIWLTTLFLCHLQQSTKKGRFPRILKRSTLNKGMFTGWIILIIAGIIGLVGAGVSFLGQNNHFGNSILDTSAYIALSAIGTFLISLGIAKWKDKHSQIIKRIKK